MFPNALVYYGTLSYQSDYTSRKPHVCGDAYVHPVFGQGLQDVQCPVSYMDNPIEPCILTVTL
jgi:hypothetical protein